jgi:glycogen operon protein
VHGPYQPQQGHRFNPHKLLLDPYAKAITGSIEWSDAMFGYPLLGGPDRDLLMDTRDSAPGMPKAVVVEPAFSWGDDRPPRTPWHDTIIYEAHVRGLTILHPELPPDSRGTYAGLADHRVISYLLRLGITAIELMPIHNFVYDRRLLERGLRNYWGYNTIGYFAPDWRYGRATSAGAQVNEFKTMVRTLHQAGIEVILDVVYNHTAEGNHFGPTLSFRGIDNQAYYRLAPADQRYYTDFTGTGNTLNMLHPSTLRLIMDSLRYWVQEMHVDGFRFDLAPTLARNAAHAFDRNGAFLSAIRQDPVLSRVKLIAEPWDIGEGGYQLGNFPPGWVEWNDKYRDAIRSFWKADAGVVGELASRLAGSSDIFQRAGRSPRSSVNFVTAHDGFTLHDLVSYERKHNEANLEGSRDGSDNNRSWDAGALKGRQKRNLLATLLFSQGPPMLLAGDEIGHTQQGNNNAYCQDNEISWLDWANAERGEQGELLEYVRRLIDLRKRHPALRRRSYPNPEDVAWLTPAGQPMTQAQWTDPATRTLGMLLLGQRLAERDDQGRPVEDDDLLLLLNAGEAAVDFALPGEGWKLLVDTAAPQRLVTNPYALEGRTLVLLAKAR